MLDFLKFWKKKEPAMPDIGGDIAPPEAPASFPERPAELGKKSDLGLPSESPDLTGPGIPGEDFARPSAGLGPEQPVAFREKDALERPMPPGAAPADSGKEFQLINAKLDTIKAGIDGLNARLDKLERKEEKEIIAWR